MCLKQYEAHSTIVRTSSLSSHYFTCSLVRFQIGIAPWLGNFKQSGAPGTFTCYAPPVLPACQAPALTACYLCTAVYLHLDTCMCHTARWQSSSSWRMHLHQQDCWRSGGRCLNCKRRWSCRSRSLLARCASDYQQQLSKRHVGRDSDGTISIVNPRHTHVLQAPTG